jgi:hypothetical protein
MLLRPSAHGRGQRPRGPVQVNWDSPQALNLHNWYPILGQEGAIYHDLVSGLHATVQASPAHLAVPEHGVVPHYDGTTWAKTGVIQKLATGTTPFSFSLWTRSVVIGGVYPTTDGLLFEVSDTGIRAPATADKALGIKQFGSGMQAFMYVYDGAVKTATGTTSVVDGLPHLIVGTYDGVTLRIYQNGVLEGSQAASSSYGAYSSPQWVFNTTASPGGQAYQGELWDVRYYYNRCLTPADVWAMYDAATRWDLYWVPSSRVFFDVAAGGGTVYNQSIALAVSSAFADSGPLTLTKSIALAIAAAVTDAAGFSFNQAVTLAVQAVYAASMQRGINEGITLQASGTVADSGPLGMNPSTGLTVSAAIAEAAALTVNSALTLGAIVGQSGFAGFAVAGSISLPTQAAAVAAFQYGVNALVTLVAQARDTESSTQSVAAAITLALQAAIAESVTAALAAAANLGARASLSGVAGFQVQGLITLIVAQQLAASYQFISGSGPQIIRLVAERLQAAALEDLSLSPAAVTNETIIDSN